MTKEWTYKPGNWYVICDDCHKKILGSDAKHRWDGFIVCADCWNPRHPQDFIKGRKETITPPFTRPRPADQFVGACDLVGQVGIVGIGVVGCAVVGRVPSDFGYTLDGLIKEFRCSPQTRLAMAGFGAADCAIVGDIESGTL